MDPITLQAALLHDVVEDTHLAVEDIEREFGSEVANLVDGLTKLDKIKFRSREQEQAENVRKMIVAMARDIRVLLIKLADRLHNMRTLEVFSRQKQQEKATETLEIYSPLAHRLGVQRVKSELDDLAFKDYIAMPKFNMYQSLHTTVIGPEGRPLEVQIRTHQMHRTAEYGIAAHWRYKDRGSKKGDEQAELEWLGRMIEWQQESADPREFME